MSIKDRIDFHQKHKGRWTDEAERLETKLNIANRKIIGHWTAVQNLVKKQRRAKKKYLR